MEGSASKGQRMRRRLSQLTIKPFINVLKTFSPTGPRVVVTLSPSDVEGPNPGPSPLPLDQLETTIDSVFLDRLAPAIQTPVQAKVALPTVAKIGVVLRRRLEEARQQLQATRIVSFPTSSREPSVRDHKRAVSASGSSASHTDGPVSFDGDFDFKPSTASASASQQRKEKPAPTAEAEPTSDPPATNTLLDSSSEDVTEEQIEAEWNRLEKRLGSMRLAQVEMDDDGNCQFRAISMQLFGTQIFHLHIRRQICEMMWKNADYFGVYFETQDAFRDFLNEMEQDGCWGNELTLKAAAEFFRTNVHVVTSSAINWYLKYSPDEPNPDIDLGRQKQIFLTYISPLHYNSLALASKATSTKSA